MTYQALINDYLAQGGTVTKCPPANVAGSEISRAAKKDIAKQRAEWRKDQREETE